MNLLNLAFLLSLVVIVSTKSSVFLNETYHSAYVPLKNNRGSLWYWLFESRSRPSKDPLLFYVPDGFTQTSAFAALSVNGPFKINKDSSTLRINPYSWNNIANLLYADLFLGAGFSYTNSVDNIPKTADKVAEDAYYLLQKFMKDHPEFKGRELYLATSGYTAKFFGNIATKIAKNQVNLNLKFKGWQVIDGLFYPAEQYPVSWPQYAYQNDLINKTFSKQLIKSWKPYEGRLTDWSNQTRIYEADAFAWGITDAIQSAVEFDPLNIKEPCSFPNTTTVVCRNFNNVGEFILQPKVIKALGISRPEVWDFSNNTVFMAISDEMFYNDARPAYAALLKSGIPGVIYAGLNDYFWNHIGQEAIASSLVWNGQSKFNKLGYQTWGKYGSYKHYDKLTYVRVKNAGFFIPIDAPAAALLGLDKLIKNKW